MIHDIVYLGQLQEKLFSELNQFIHSGVNVLKIYDYIEKFIQNNKLSYINKTIPISINVNNIVYHGKKKSHTLKNNDILTIDICFSLDKNKIDGAKTFLVGNSNSELQNLITTNINIIKEVIKIINVGIAVKDVIKFISHLVENNDYYLFKGGMGHGIGKTLHESPFISLNNFKDFEYIFKKGDLFTLEPIILLHKENVLENDLDEGYIDINNKSSQFEITLLIKDIDDIKVLNYGLLN